MFSKLSFIGIPFYILSTMGFKISLLASIMRIAVDRTYIMFLTLVLVLTAVLHLAFLFTQIFLCAPVSSRHARFAAILGLLPAGSLSVD
jgi:hypothetical protein